ncbi:MAG: hypothetical protein SOX31_11080 [Eubacteriales bacterium]|nr:hypothetical protein [Clostridiales bacterium]MDY3072971.1 hypothetical protein [Eubacteriales bacterium]MDY3287090.1 hypothetical protein [Eubacteriales bacterium]MDY5015745.1 hypothetical protein [Eubacteriales bacterium]
MVHTNRTYDSTYVYSADMQEEVRKIYQKYSPQEERRKAPSEEEEKMEQLRRLDRSVTRAGAAAAWITGLCGAGVHGIGTALIRSETMFVPGTVAAIAGVALFLAAFPVYGAAVKKRRRRVEAQILKLCRELMK